MANRDLVVRFIGDDRDLQRAFASSSRDARRFGSDIDRTTGKTKQLNQGLRGALSGFGSKSSLLFGSGAFIGTAGATAFAKTAIDSASDLNEQLSRIEVILGDSAQATIEWSRTTAASIGISQRAALSASATFAGLFQTVGVDTERAGELSRTLVQLAADLASLQNSSPEEALIALRSGLAGEAEPLRRFNIFLTEARVQQEALSESGKKSVTTLTAQEKALARYNLILKDSAPAQGNFALTSGGLANQTRILRANLDDLSSNVGNVLVPVLTDATEAANLLFVALSKFRGVDFSPGFDIPDLPDFLSGAAVAPISPLGALALGIKHTLEDDKKLTAEITDQLNSSVQSGIVKLQEALEKRKKAINKAASVDLAQSRKAFERFTKGMGLKLDKAGLTADLNDDISVLRELERAILRRIEQEGKTFKLVKQLVDVRGQIAGLVGTQAEDAAQKARDAWQKILDSFALGLDRAGVTKSLADDLAVLQDIQTAIKRRIAAEGSTLELERELFRVQQQIADARRQQAEAQKARQQGRQFEAIGLTAEGDQRAPGAGALRRRLGNIQEQIKGTILDTNKTRSQLAGIAKVLSGAFGKVGKDVRSAILQMFNDISSALEQGRKGPLTKTSGLNTKKILEDLGLTPEQQQELRGRLSSFNTAGRTPAGSQNRPTGGGFTGGTGFVIENNVTVQVGSQKIAAVVTKEEQKRKRRNPQQKRGPNRHR